MSPPGEVGPQLWESWQWRAAQVTGKVWQVTCACTQDPWWQQQKPLPTSGVQDNSCSSLLPLELT